MSQLKQVILAELYLDSGTEYVSGERVRKNVASPPAQVIYSGTVERWGTIEKTIPCPTGMPQISNARVKITDRYRKWRDLLANQTPRRRGMRLYVLPEGASLADYAPVYDGEIVDVIFTPAAIEVSLRDRTFAWLDETIPAMAIASIYGDMVKPQDEGGFVPIIFGNCYSVEASPVHAQGVIPLPHIGAVTYGSPPVTYDRWALSATPIVAATILRREKVQIDADVDAPEWQIVDEAEYVLTEFPITAEDNPFGNFGMTHICVDFLPAGSPPGLQPEGTELRADVSGIFTRGAWGDLPELATSPLLATLNPIDAFINMTFFLMVKAGVSVDVFDTDEISQLWAIFENSGLYCSGAITEPITGREWLGRFLASFNLDMYVNRRGLITLQFTQDFDEYSPPLTPPTFKEGKHILLETFNEKLPEKVVTQLQYRWNWNNATRKFDSDDINNTAEQVILNVDDTDKIEKDVFDLYFVRDANTASEIAARRLQFQALGSFRQEFEMPMPATVDDVELAQLCKLTHSMGLQSPNGYEGRQAKILGVQLDLDALKFRLQTVVYPPVQIRWFGRPATAEGFDDPDFVNPIRSTITDPDYGADSDAPLGESATFCVIEHIHPNTVAQYCHLKFYGFPEPTRTIVSATLHVVVSYTVGTGTLIGFNFPSVEVNVLDTYTNANFTDGAFAAALVTNMLSGDGSGDIPLTEVTTTYNAAQFESFFDGSAANIFIRCEIAQVSLEDFSPSCFMKIYDCWIEYVYA